MHWILLLDINRNLILRQDNLTSRMPTKLAIANTKEDNFWQFS
ncbi:hypothetical protein [Nostoc sp. EfeVER01]|nr:hypothetical protein [Nostoc sp. EfeVER01]